MEEQGAESLLGCPGRQWLSISVKLQKPRRSIRHWNHGVHGDWIHLDEAEAPPILGFFLQQKNYLYPRKMLLTVA